MVVKASKLKMNSVEFVESLKRRWMATVDALIDPLIIVDSQFTVKKANKAFAEYSGQDVKSMVGQKCYQVFGGRNKPCQGCEMNQAFIEKSSRQFNLESFRGSRYLEVTSQPIFDPEDGTEGTLQVYRDRTNARQMEQQLQQTEKLASIGLLAGGVAHEINNPLGGILVFSQMMLKEMAKTSKHYQDVVEIEAATQRCKAIVESLLDFARLQPVGSEEQDEERVNLREAMESAIQFSKVGGHNHNIEIESKWPETASIVKGNRNKLIQLFLNLIQNAIHAMPDGGKLWLKCNIETGKEFPGAVVEIVDTGVGIPEDTIKKIFDPFFTSKNPGEGTGLGLSICHSIVEELRGVIEVESAVNAGSCFRIKFPLDKEPRLKGI